MKFQTLGLIAIFSASAIAADPPTGDLKIRFLLKGDIPQPKEIAAVGCGNAQVPDESLVVNPRNLGIANIFVSVYTGRSRAIPKFAAGKAKHTLANKNCRFEPHAFIVQAGDTINVTNPDAVGHNVNVPFYSNRPLNQQVAPGKEFSFQPNLGEPAPVTIVCNAHPWMSARLLVLDHPFADISDQDGEILIRGLPIGKLTFRANHERGSFKNQIFVNGKKSKWRSNRFEIKIKPGLNDLGTIEIPDTEF